MAALQLLFVFAFLIGAAFSQCYNGNIYANSGDSTCKSYYTCSTEGTYLEYCQNGQIFYPNMKQCVLENSYDCQCNQPDCTRPTCNQPDGDQPDPKNCNKYVYCTRGNPLRRFCPSGNLYNPNSGTCEDRSTSNYVCPSGPFVCPSANNLYADLNDPQCRAYYSCNNGAKTPLLCDNGMRFYEGLRKCVLSDSYDCHSRYQFPCPKDQPDRDYQDNSDRRRFYYCTEGYPLHRRCPDGQTFNPDNNVRRCQ